MGTLTTYLGLFKPAVTDTSDQRLDLSNNFDIIDAEAELIRCPIDAL